MLGRPLSRQKPIREGNMANNVQSGYSDFEDFSKFLKNEINKNYNYKASYQKLSNTSKKSYTGN